MMEQSALKAVLLLVVVLSWPAGRQPPTVELMGFVVEGLPDMCGGLERTFGTWDRRLETRLCWRCGGEEGLLVRWSEDLSVLRSSTDWQLVLLDRDETVHQLHGLVNAPDQGRVNIVFLPTARVERTLEDFHGHVALGLAELLCVGERD